MAFEHDQFARFMAAPASARNGHHLSVVHPQQKPPVLARPPRRVVAKMDGTTTKRRRALIVVTLKLALLCGWLLHELIVSFDESQCLQIAAAGASPASPFVVTSPSHNMAQAPLLSSTAAANRTETDAKLEQYRRFGATGEMLGVRVPLNVGQSPMPPPTASSPFAAGAAAAAAVVVEEQRQFHRTDSKNSAVAPHPKRRRKVILRRKLLRKGASTVNWQQQKKKGGAGGGGGIVNGGAATVRRVVWRVVPLKRLPPTTTKDDAGGIGLPAGDGDKVQRRLDAFPFENEFASVPSAIAGDKTGGWPLRTKTGTVVVRPDGGRRMARRRTAPEAENAVVVADAVASTDEAEAAEAFDWTQKNAQNGGPPHSFRVPLLQQSKSSISYQLITLMNVGFCFVRAVFDCWALLQCFCCALFLLGLYLRNGRLALVPTAVDAFSIVLAVLFGLSLVIFMLILLLLAHAVLPPSSLFRCVLFTVSVNVGVTLFAFCVFTELNAVAEMTKGRRRKIGQEGRAKAADDESMAAAADGAATEWGRSGDDDSDAGGDGER